MSKIIDGIKYDDARTQIFDGSEAVGEIVIPDGVRSIEQAAFQNSKIRSIIFPDSLKFIGSYAFQGCKQLERVEFGEELSRIGNFAFANCNHLSNIVFGENLLRIEDGAFLQTAIEKIILPSSVQYLGDYCFYTLNLKEFICENFETYYIDAIATSMYERPDKDEWPEESYIIKLVYGGKIRYMPKFIYKSMPTYVTPLHRLADSDTLQYATAIKEYECTKDKGIFQFLIRKSFEIAVLMLQSGKEEAFIRFLKLNVIPDNVIQDILSITATLNVPIASAYLSKI